MVESVQRGHKSNFRVEVSRASRASVTIYGASHGLGNVSGAICTHSNRPKCSCSPMTSSMVAEIGKHRGNQTGPHISCIFPFVLLRLARRSGRRSGEGQTDLVNHRTRGIRHTCVNSVTGEIRTEISQKIAIPDAVRVFSADDTKAVRSCRWEI